MISVSNAFRSMSCSEQAGIEEQRPTQVIGNVTIAFEIEQVASCEHFPTDYRISISGDRVAEPIGLTPQQKHTDSHQRMSMRGRAPALPAQLSSFCKKPDDLGERRAILPEKLMAAFEHAQDRPWDSSSHVFL